MTAFQASSTPPDASLHQGITVALDIVPDNENPGAVAWAERDFARPVEG